MHWEFLHQGKLPGRWLPLSLFLELSSEFPLLCGVIQSTWLGQLPQLHVVGVVGAQSATPVIAIVLRQEGDRGLRTDRRGRRNLWLPGSPGGFPEGEVGRDSGLLSPTASLLLSPLSNLAARPCTGAWVLGDRLAENTAPAPVWPPVCRSSAGRCIPL